MATTEKPLRNPYTSLRMEAGAAVAEMPSENGETGSTEIKTGKWARKEADADKRLRSRVRLFGNLLGSVIREQAGGNVLSSVEYLRKGFISLSKKNSPKRRAYLMQHIDRLDLKTLEQIIRSFSTYFGLVNIVEEAHNHRTRTHQSKQLSKDAFFCRRIASIGRCRS